MGVGVVEEGSRSFDAANDWLGAVQGRVRIARIRHPIQVQASRSGRCGRVLNDVGLDHFQEPGRTLSEGLEDEPGLQGNESNGEAKGLEATTIRWSDHPLNVDKAGDLLRRGKWLTVTVPNEPVGELCDVVADASRDRRREGMVPEL